MSGWDQVMVLRANKPVHSLPRCAMDVCGPFASIHIDASHNIDTVADVCEALWNARKPASAALPPELVKYHDMVCMRLLCDELCVDFDRWIRPAFTTLGAYERCAFLHESYDGFIYITFHAGRVHVELRTDRARFHGTCDYSVDSPGFLIRAPQPMRLNLPDDDDSNETDLILLYGSEYRSIAIMRNMTPDAMDAHAAPAIPHVSRRMTSPITRAAPPAAAAPMRQHTSGE